MTKRATTISPNRRKTTDFLGPEKPLVLLHQPISALGAKQTAPQFVRGRFPCACLAAEIKLNPLEDRDDGDGGGGQEADKEEKRIEEPDGNLQRARICQFVVDDFPAEVPAHEEDYQ